MHHAITLGARRASWQMASPSRSQSSHRMSQAAPRASLRSMTCSGSQPPRTPVTSCAREGSMRSPSAQERQPFQAGPKSLSSRCPKGVKGCERVRKRERGNDGKRKRERACDGCEAHVALRALDGAPERPQRVEAHAGAAERQRAPCQRIGLRAVRRCCALKARMRTHRARIMQQSAPGRHVRGRLVAAVEDARHLTRHRRLLSHVEDCDRHGCARRAAPPGGWRALSAWRAAQAAGERGGAEGFF
jgi:hypothetical protein